MTLLNKVDVLVGYTGGVCIAMVAPIVIFGIVALLTVGFLVLCDDIMESVDRVCLFLIIIACCLFGGTLGAIGYSCGGDKILETQYQVMFDDSISINEIYDKYEVIDQQGRIFTIKEKTADTN